MKSLAVKSIAAAAALSFASMANATVLATYNVSDTSRLGCSGTASHGLWTGTTFGAAESCKNFFSIQNGGTFTIYDDVGDIKADLDATAINIDGIEATIDFTFGGFAETYHRTKNGGGSYDPLTDYPDWDFFTTIEDSTISFDSGFGDFDDFSFVTPDSDGPLVFQFGYGANDKDGSLGASTWLLNDDVTGHWDINITVPEPSSLGLLGLGLIGLGMARRKQAKA